MFSESFQAVRELERRLAELERRLQTGFVTLQMTDGTTRAVSCRRLLAMVGEVQRGQIDDDTQAVLDATSDNCEAAGFGHMTDVVRVMAAARVSVAEEREEVSDE